MDEINITEGVLGALLSLGVIWGTWTQRQKAGEKKQEALEIAKMKQDEDIKRIDREQLKQRARIEMLENLVLPTARRGVGETLNPDTRRHR